MQVVNALNKKKAKQYLRRVQKWNWNLCSEVTITLRNTQYRARLAYFTNGNTSTHAHETTTGV